MIRKYKVELEIVIQNKGNLISQASGKVPYSLLKEYWKAHSVERAIRVSLENANDYMDVQQIMIEQIK